MDIAVKYEGRVEVIWDVTYFDIHANKLRRDIKAVTIYCERRVLADFL